MSLWEKNPQRYKDLYFDNRNELRVTNAGMQYGKVVADALEHGVQTGDLLTDAGMLLLPKYDIADKEIEAEFSAKGGWIKVLGKPDSLDSKTKNFYEFKTGKTQWTQEKAQEHLQMHYYGMCIFLKFKIVPKKAALVWIETEMTPEGIKPTGRVEEFPVKITMVSIVETMARVAKAAREIEIAFAAHVPDPRIANF